MIMRGVQLIDAKNLHADGYAAVSGYSLYMAAINAANAVVFEMTGQTITRHNRVGPVWGKLVEDGFAQGAAFTQMFPQLYLLKASSDYGIRRPGHVPPHFAVALEQVEIFFKLVEQTIFGPGSPPHTDNAL